MLDNATGLFHMWSAEMLDHCGINSWTTNSHVIHAVAKSEAGPFNRTNEVRLCVCAYTYTRVLAIATPPTGCV